MADVRLAPVLAQMREFLLADLGQPYAFDLTQQVKYVRSARRSLVTSWKIAPCLLAAVHNLLANYRSPVETGELSEEAQVDVTHHASLDVQHKAYTVHCKPITQAVPAILL